MLRGEAAKILADATGGGQPRDGDFIYFYEGDWIAVPASEMLAVKEHTHDQYALQSELERIVAGLTTKWGDILEKPSTLEGFGISDGVTTTQLESQLELLLTDHLAEPNPHTQYLLANEADTLYEALGTAAASMIAHEAEVDPHPQYLTGPEGDSAYDPLGIASDLISSHNTDTFAVHGIADTSVLETVSGAQTKVNTAMTAHEGEVDPHPQYLTAADELDATNLVGALPPSTTVGGTYEMESLTIAASVTVADLIVTGSLELPFLLVDGPSTLNGDVSISTGTWDTGHLVLGAYHIWVDNTGRLRIKSSAPTSATDGTVVGTQT